jgi:hypothetical protein
MAISRPRADILVRNLKGDPIAIVEVKNLKDLSRDEAIELRHNLIEYGIPSHVPYFMLLSQDVGFLWTGTQHEYLDAPPMYEFPMDKVVARYSDRKPGQRLYEAELEVLVLRWLTNLATKPQKNIEEPERTLALSGFIDSIKDASVLIEAEL